MKREIVLIYLLSLLCSTAVFGQSQKISGKIFSVENAPLPKVSVQIKGTATGVLSDENGHYTITASKGNTLVFSSVGHDPQEVTVGDNSVIDIILTPKVSALDGVVVVGYGTQKKTLVTTSVSSINAADISKQVTNNALLAMAGQMAGVEVQQGTGKPGANPVVRVRGTGSITAANIPLYVVDGMPLANSDDFNMINPSDIESIDVLKDAASAAIYGSRGGNGVVMVTTRKGKKGKSSINFSYYTGVQQVAKTLDMMDRNAHISYIKKYTNYNYLSSGGDPAIPNGQRKINGAAIGYNYIPAFDTPESLPNTDGQKEIFRAAPISNYQLSAQGGSDRVTYYLSGNYFTQDGIIRGTDYKRFSARANVDAKLNDYFRAGMNFSPSHGKENKLVTDGHFNGTEGEGAVMFLALLLPPTVQAKYPNGLYGSTLGNPLYTNAGYNGLVNPLQMIEDPKFIYQDGFSRLMGSTYLEFEPLKKLVFKTSLGVDYRQVVTDKYRPSTVSTITNAVRTPELPNANINNIAASHAEYRGMTYSFDNTVTYDTDLGDHHLNVMLGYSVQKFQEEASTLTGQSGKFDNDLVTNVSGASIVNATNNKSEWSLLSYIGRANYAYKNKYLLSGVLRRDGSSRFASNNKWALFPSVSVGWRLLEEPFMQSVKFLSELKLRASYGVTGNFNIGNYSSKAILIKDNYSFGDKDGALAAGFAPGNLENANLTWETNKQTDIGIDFGALQNRLRVSVDYYERMTEGLLYNLPVPGISGFTSFLGNAGKIQNKGIELEINSTNIRKNDFQWTSSAVFSLNRNKVLQLGFSNASITVTTENSVTQITQIGRPMAEFYGYQIAGIFQNDEDVRKNPSMRFNASAGAGSTKFVDTDGDGVITPKDRVILGNPQPDFTYGINNKFTWKGWNLDLQLQGVSGGSVYFLAQRFIGVGGFNNKLSVLSDSWFSASDPGNGQPAGNAVGNNESNVQRWLYSGSYLRLRNVNLGYNLPSSITKRVRMNSARIYFTGQNLVTFTKYIGYDPEVNFKGENPTSPGIDYGVYPLARTFTFGINIGL